MIGRLITLVGDVMNAVQQDDFPVGHPARFDYDPASPEAKEWARIHVHPRGERDFPVDHPKAVDTPGNSNSMIIVAGIDPTKPWLEAFTGRTQEQARAVAQMNARLAEQAKPTPPRQPVDAADWMRAYMQECARLNVTELDETQYNALAETMGVIPPQFEE
jgi:hypothetical protein